MLKNKLTYEIMDAESIGLAKVTQKTFLPPARTNNPVIGPRPVRAA